MSDERDRGELMRKLATIRCLDELEGFIETLRAMKGKGAMEPTPHEWSAIAREKANILRRAK